MASKRAQRRKACGGKVRYETTMAAMEGLRALTRAKGFQGTMVPYRCRFCNGYHYGHPPAAVRRAINGGH